MFFPRWSSVGNWRNPTPSSFMRIMDSLWHLSDHRRLHIAKALCFPGRHPGRLAAKHRCMVCPTVYMANAAP